MNSKSFGIQTSGSFLKGSCTFGELSMLYQNLYTYFQRIKFIS